MAARCSARPKPVNCSSAVVEECGLLRAQMGALLRKALGTQLGPGQGCEWGMTTTLSTPSLRVLPDSPEKPGQPQALGQKVGFSLGGSETEVLTGAVIGQLVFFILLGFFKWICPSWQVRAKQSCVPFGGDCKWLCLGSFGRSPDL